MYISLFGKKEKDTKIYFTQGDKVAIGSNDVLEYAFEVGNFFNILQSSTTEANIRVYRHNLLLALNKLFFFKKIHPYEHTRLIESIFIYNRPTEFCELLVKYYPQYYSF